MYDQRIMQLVLVHRLGPHLFAHARNRSTVELTEIARACGFGETAGSHRQRAALLGWRVVKERVRLGGQDRVGQWRWRSEEHKSELQSLMRISYAVFCLQKKTNNETQ